MLVELVNAGLFLDFFLNFALHVQCLGKENFVALSLDIDLLIKTCFSVNIVLQVIPMRPPNKVAQLYAFCCLVCKIYLNQQIAHIFK